MKSLLRAFALLLLSVSLAAAQTAVVKRNVNLRPDPSTTNPPIEKLVPPTPIQLLEPNPTNGFLHAQDGWVWAKNVQVQPAAPPAAGGGGTPTGGSPATAISSDWDKPTPQISSFFQIALTPIPSTHCYDFPTDCRSESQHS